MTQIELPVQAQEVTLAASRLPSMLFCTELLIPVKGWSLCPFSLSLDESWDLAVPKECNGDDALSGVWRDPAVGSVAQWGKSLPSLHEVLSSIPNTAHTSSPRPGEVEAGRLEVKEVLSYIGSSR